VVAVVNDQIFILLLKIRRDISCNLHPNYKDLFHKPDFLLIKTKKQAL
jgi:hypothetical protein